MWRFVLWFPVAFVATVTGEYVGGRVILPEVGLTAPGWWTWFWFTSWASIFGLVATFAKEQIDE